MVTLLNIIGHPIIGSLCEAGTSTLAQYILVVSLSHIGLLKFWSLNFDMLVTGQTGLDSFGLRLLSRFIWRSGLINLKSQWS